MRGAPCVEERRTWAGSWVGRGTAWDSSFLFIFVLGCFAISVGCWKIARSFAHRRFENPRQASSVRTFSFLFFSFFLSGKAYRENMYFLPIIVGQFPTAMTPSCRCFFGLCTSNTRFYRVYPKEPDPVTPQYLFVAHHNNIPRHDVNMADRSDFAHLLPPSWKKHVQLWLEDDIPSYDIGGFVVGETQETAFLLGKSKGVLAGVPFFTEVFTAVDCKVEWLLKEGDLVDPSTTAEGKVVVAKVTGKCRNILLGERTALNILTRASGIATQAKHSVDIARALGWNGHVAGTRKTTPGFRLVEKYALLVAGASTHRHDLSQMVMLKDNHVWAAGSITNAVLKAKRAAGFSMKIEVECRKLEEAVEAANAGADIVMLDNFEPEKLKETAATLKAQFPHLLIEASGGITPDTLGSYVSPHVDIVSQGKLTQGYGFLDFSLKIQKADGVLPQ